VNKLVEADDDIIFFEGKAYKATPIKIKKKANMSRKQRLKAIERGRALKQRCIELKGGCCQDCGGIFNPAAYDFHHTNPDLKQFNIATALQEKWSDVERELNHCVLLCANCHRTRHAKLVDEKYANTEEDRIDEDDLTYV
jgi:5-methylcytosine-specific restriction endonuclease McrA